jgi:hypothetical protein
MSLDDNINKDTYLLRKNGACTCWLESSFFHFYSTQKHTLLDDASHIEGRSFPLQLLSHFPVIPGNDFIGHTQKYALLIS